MRAVQRRRTRVASGLQRLRERGDGGVPVSQPGLQRLHLCRPHRRDLPRALARPGGISQ